MNDDDVQLTGGVDPGSVPGTDLPTYGYRYGNDRSRRSGTALLDDPYDAPYTVDADADVATTTRAWVREQPLTAIGIAALIGYVMGRMRR